MKTPLSLLILSLFALTLAACNPTGETPTPEIATVPAVGTPSEGNTPPADVTALPAATATPEPRTLTLCLGAEPDSLYLYGSDMHTQRNILEAIYDGPFDTNSYGYQPVILEKIPSLADGSATLQPVTVKDGDLVVDADGNVTTLARVSSSTPPDASPRPVPPPLRAAKPKWINSPSPSPSSKG